MSVSGFFCILLRSVERCSCGAIWGFILSFIKGSLESALLWRLCIAPLQLQYPVVSAEHVAVELDLSSLAITSWICKCLVFCLACLNFVASIQMALKDSWLMVVMPLWGPYHIESGPACLPIEYSGSDMSHNMLLRGKPVSSLEYTPEVLSRETRASHQQPVPADHDLDGLPWKKISQLQLSSCDFAVHLDIRALSPAPGP